MSATPEISEELEWFLERFPLNASEEDAAELSLLATMHRDRQAKIRSTISLEYKKPALLMAKPPREYQDQAAELCYRVGGILCADELGLGKTITAIALLARKRTLPAVIVVPINVLDQWSKKIEEFFPQAAVCIIKTNPSIESGRAMLRRRKADIILIAYSRLSSWKEILNPRTVIFDEVHELRHVGSNKYIAATEVRAKAKFCMGLSATPIFNYGGEFYNVLGAISPGSLGERSEFLREWCSDSGDKKARIQDPVAFGTWIRSQGLMIRRSRRDVGRELPPIIRCVFDISIDGSCQDELESIAWQSIYGAPKDRFLARGELDLRLRQWTGVSKAPAVAAFVDELLESSGESVLLSGWHHAVYDIWKNKLAHWNPVFYTGIEDVKNKTESVHKFVSGKTKLMIMSLRSGQGLDGLQEVCKRVVHGELDWSPHVHQQLTGRIHRDGQGESTMEYWPIADEGSDPVIMDTLGVKRWQSDGVVDPDSHRMAEVKSDPNAMRKLAEDYLRKRGLDPKAPPKEWS